MEGICEDSEARLPNVQEILLPFSSGTLKCSGKRGLIVTKICHLTSVHQYNDTRIFHKECASLADAGYEVYLIAPVNQPFVERGVKVLPAGSHKSRIARLCITIPRLLFQALRNNAEIFHFHDPELLLIAPILRLSGAKVIYDVHEDYLTSIPTKAYIPRLIRGPLARLAGFLEILASKCCSKIIAEKYYRERFRDATEILNYPLSNQSDITTADVDCSIFDPQFDWLLYSGNITRDRGALTHIGFLEACDNTAIAYIGRCRSSLAEVIYADLATKGIDPGRVKFIGIDEYVAPEYIANYTHKCRWLAGIALFPYSVHYEKKELTKFFEYMSAGLPVIATDFDAWRNVIEGNMCGLCISPDDPEGIANAVSLLQAQRETAHTMGMNGRESVARKYNWPSEARKLIQLYRSLLNMDSRTTRP